MSPEDHACHRSCCAAPPAECLPPGVSRRDFLRSVGAAAAVGAALTLGDAAAGSARQGRRPLTRLPLRVQPVLTYEVPVRREATSWRSWGGIQTEAQAAAEAQRIGRELAALAARAGFPLEVLPVIAMRDSGKATAVASGPHDVLVVFAAGGGGDILEALTKEGRWNLMFLRHDPGPVYLWYEIVHPRFLRKTVDAYGQPGMDVHDVVVDDYDEVLWRLRALYGLRNTLGKRIVAVGGASGWGWGGQEAPALSRSVWKLDIRDFPYSRLAPMLKQARDDGELVARSRAEAGRYLSQPGTRLQTTRAFVENAFVLRDVLRRVMDEADTDAITINSCMGTIMPMSETTACLPLSLLNDDGYLAFCESDFVVIPSGILLHYISGNPVFLNDPTLPHGDIVTLAHCTAPRRMDGKRAERTIVLTHFESDYGAAPQVEMRIGQRCTNLVPDFASKEWLGFEGIVAANPKLDICRSQVDMRVVGDSGALLEQMKGFHWMASYGVYLREVGYALKKAGVGFRDLSAAAKAPARA